MKRRVLFVDDEPKIIDGLRRMLRNLRHELDMEFATSGPEALEILDTMPFDVVVSDMRMPGMDGSQLLTHVRERHPQIVRIILSGHSNRESILRTVRVAHQYLNKPCDPEELKSTVVRSCALRDLLTNEGLIGILSQIESIPSAPSLYREITNALQSPEATVEKVSEIVSKDVGMTAKILQMTNSAFFGLPQRATNLERAVTLLGMDTIRVLVMTVEIFSMYEHVSLSGFPVSAWLDHSSMVAAVAKMIVREAKGGRTVMDDAFTAGILHDVGKLVLATNLKEDYRRVLALCHEQGKSVVDAEQEILGTTHAEVGAYLMGLWGLPTQVVEAIAFHHCPAKCPVGSFCPLTAVHAGDTLVNGANSHDTHVAAAQLDLDYLARLNLSEHIPVWKAEFEDIVSSLN